MSKVTYTLFDYEGLRADPSLATDPGWSEFNTLIDQLLSCFIQTFGEESPPPLLLVGWEGKHVVEFVSVCPALVAACRGDDSWPYAIWIPDRRHGSENPFYLLSEFLTVLAGWRNESPSVVDVIGLGFDWNTAACAARQLLVRASIPLSNAGDLIERAEAAFFAAAETSNFDKLDQEVHDDALSKLCDYTNHAWKQERKDRGSTSLTVLLDAARAASLKGKQLDLVKAVVERGGRLSKADAALHIETRDPISIYKAVRPKLKQQGWNLYQYQGHICADRLPAPKK
jgi:hypothetical protein